MRPSPSLRVMTGATIAAAIALHAGESRPGVTIVHGLCTNCEATLDLGQMQFVTDSIGWASASRLPPGNGSGLATVLHTTDGGRHWRRLRFVWQSGAEEEPPFSFVDSNNGWVASFDMESATGRLSRTRDGGRTWKHRECDPLRQLRFFDLRNGVAVSGSSFRTTADGGETWMKVDLPFGGTDIMSFRNRRTGIIVGRPTSGRLRAIVTRDGGAHWTEARLPDRIDGTGRSFAWLDSETALLAIRYRDRSESELLQTRDGGATWRRHPYETFQGTGKAISAIAFSSDRRGAIFYDDTKSGQSLVASTSDGGAMWQINALPSAVSDCQMRGNTFRCSSGTDVLKIELENR